MSTNVWTQMNYIPPRGPCNHKPSMLSPKCPCLRFMLHPLKSTSSYECDGCAHHASFHSMENKAEDEVRKQWEKEAAEKEEEDSQQRSKKRPRLLLREKASSETMDSVFGQARGRAAATTTKTRRVAATKGRARGKGRVEGEEEAVIELD
ncbi:hypothetical protein HBH69_165950 [Parastagonospora nodorum]|nr:hypothetical protein HBI09_209730 [Parastagonospora nodorum]KAH4600804.1 hypothetical protein HBH82_185080 [Parastagonospora nodorum]KAH4663735.1 hypothetical protein HBH78_211360 [Parastagonospora nodorum]KAH4698308.1 hypothetical protein HBH67_176040 [Parastagonospora nodorum]KAH4759223.1 hypothetical protein HBH63_221350 [Parastagonospora nodorum]